MHNKLLSILMIMMISISITGQSLDDIRDSINNQTIIYETDIIVDRDRNCSNELGSELFFSKRISIAGSSSCDGNCHGGPNLLPLDGDLQGSEGIVFLDDGWQECRYAPLDIKPDIIDTLNSPMVRGLMYKSKVLHDGKTTKEMQPTVMFGGTAHQIDWELIAETPKFMYYAARCYNRLRFTQEVFVQAILDFENSLDHHTSYQEWLEGGKPDRFIKKAIPIMWHAGCMDCHQGRGGVSELMGPAVINSRGTQITGDSVMVRPWFYSEDFEYQYWNRSYKSGSKWGYKNHFESCGIQLTDKEIKSISKCIEKSFN